MTGTYARVIADSISPEGHRLTTMEIRFHRFVLAEFNTHRVFSRNSSSSRARPAHKNLDDVWESPAIPYSFPEEQGGMQGGGEVEYKGSAKAIWLEAANKACHHAEELIDLGVHKSVVNRLLEPFLWHTVIVTSTAWDNYFNQRVSPLAQSEIRAVAQMMQDAYEDSAPHEIGHGGYHLPYITADDFNDLNSRGVPWDEIHIAQRKVSAARCARVSYLTHDGVRSIDKDIELYDDKLMGSDPPHWSPLEHVAMSDPWNIREFDIPPRDKMGQVIFESSGPYARLTLPKVGNFVGWTQQRFLVEQERGVRTYA